MNTRMMRWKAETRIQAQLRDYMLKNYGTTEVDDLTEEQYQDYQEYSQELFGILDGQEEEYCESQQERNRL